MTVGFGAAVTGSFSVGGMMVSDWRKADEQRCSVAQQIVIDESPSPALNEPQRRRLGLLAMRALEQCLGETI
jgi:acetyl/propionyl-CoA carboxylase alpha subunit